MKKSICLFAFCAILLSTAHVSAEMLYYIDFEPPTHTDGSAPAVGWDTDTLSRIRFGEPLVMDSFNIMPTQSLVFNPNVDEYEQVVLDMPYGLDQYSVSFDILTQNLNGSRYDFDVIFDTPNAVSFIFSGSGVLYVFPSTGASMLINSFNDNEVMHIDIDIDMAALQLVIRLNGSIAVQGNFPASGFDIGSIRFNLSPRIGGTSINPNVFAAIDNILVTGGPATGPDQDNDGIPDNLDNCPQTFNSDQSDCDANGVGDACDTGSVCCLDNTSCGLDSYCNKFRECGGIGFCTPRPIGCIDVVDPVCGCDGVTYFNDCEAAEAGTPVAYLGACSVVENLVGLFTIEAGSFFNMLGVGRAELAGGTDGGLLTGRYQPDPSPTTPSADTTGSDRIVDPATFVFFGFPAYVSTNDTDPSGQPGSYPPPSIIDNMDGTLTGDLSAWDALWNGTHFNQGAPKPSTGDPAPSGTYDTSTGAYSLFWESLILGGPFEGFIGQWTLVGQGPGVKCLNDSDCDGVPDSLDNCPWSPNPDQGDLDGDGQGDACDTDADGDQYDKSTDCNDLNPNINPGVLEVCGNSVDENCDGLSEICEHHDVAVTLLRVPKKIRNCSLRAKKIRAELGNPGEFTEKISLIMTVDGIKTEEKTLILDPLTEARATYELYPFSLASGPAEICVEALLPDADQAPADNKVCAMTSVVSCQ